MDKYVDQQNIHPCTTRPPNVNNINFNIQFQQDFHKLMNICNWHKCNHDCYRNNKDFKNQLCRYEFLKTIIKETNFEHNYRLLHIKRNDRWLNNVSPWIMNACHCNHDSKFITTFEKDSKALNY
jgi:hypothetical protein